MFLVAIPAVEIKSKDVYILKECLLESLKKRFDYVYQDEIFLAAAFLDYQFKNFEFMSKVNPNNTKLVLKQIKKYIIDFYKQRIEKPVNINEVALTAQTQTQTQNVLTDNNPRRKQQGILSLTQDKLKVCAKPAIELEIKLYQNFSWSSKNKEMQNAHGPLLFFKENMETFPLLSQIAKAIFCMLPASLASERLFRGSGRIVTTDRNSLNPKNLEYLTLIKNNRVV